MKDETLCWYFTDSPAWERQLKQLRKKSLAGYSDGVIPLGDASDAECQAPEGLLSRQFIPSHMHYRPLRSERRSALSVAYTFWKTRWCSPRCAGSRGSCIPCPVSCGKLS